MVSEFTHPGEKEICGKFCLQFVEWSRSPNNLTGRPDAVRIYAASNQSRSEFRFHINTYESFMQHYRVHDTELQRLQVIEVPLYEPAPAEFNFAEGASLLEPQIPLVDFMLSPGTSKLVELRTGGGKAQPLYSKIKIPGGWTTMGDIKVGDIVSTPDGGTAPVIGVFPQGVKDIYEVKLNGGAKTRCCLEHLWVIYTGNDFEERLVNTAELIDLIAADEDYIFLARYYEEDGLKKTEYQVVDSVTLMGQEEAQCIMIDSKDHLYITDDFIVTHNTFCALWVIKELKKRAAIVLKGGYIDRWLPDLINKKDKASLLGLDPDQVRVIRGLGAMADLCFDAMMGKLDESLIVFSTDTLRLYEEHYELMNGDMSLYANIPPHFLWECLGVGVKVTDEIHQLFHANFKQDLYSHIPLTISLSATMIPSDPLKAFLYDVMFPKTSRTDPGVYKKFVEVFAMMYGLEWQSKTDLRWNRRGSKDYNQNEFEKSILKNKKVRERYINMITDHVQRAYVDRRIAKEKCLIFCGSVDMCSVIRDHFRKMWPDIVSHRYCNADPFTNIAEAEIIISTVGSLGTAHDIADLWQVHKTVGLGKEDTNLQVIGRLREMKNFPGRAPEMYYFVCQDIEKHLRYHRVKQELFKDRVVKHVVYDTGVTI